MSSFFSFCRLCLFLVGLLVILKSCLIVKVFCIFRYKSLIWYTIWEYFLPFCKLPFYFPDALFCSTKLYNFDEVQFIYFSLILCEFGVISKKPLPDLRLKVLLPCFCLMVYSFNSLFRLMIYFNFCIWYKVETQLLSFACAYPAAMVQFTEKTILSY